MSQFVLRYLLASGILSQRPEQKASGAPRNTYNKRGRNAMLKGIGRGLIAAVSKIACELVNAIRVPAAPRLSA